MNLMNPKITFDFPPVVQCAESLVTESLPLGWSSLFESGVTGRGCLGVAESCATEARVLLAFS